MRKFEELYSLKRFILIIFMFFICSIGAFASDNSLSGIDIKQDSNGEYKIFLKTNKSPVIKKTSDKEGSLYITLNKTIPSDSMEIIYDNMQDIQNIIVQKKNNNTLVMLQGQNILNSQIYVKDLSTGTIKQVNNQNIPFIQNKNTAVPIGIILFILLCSLKSRPKQKTNTQNTKTKTSKTRKNIIANTLRNKNLLQTKTIPSINYSINGSFNSANYYMTKPNDLAVNNEIAEEKIRKAG